MSTAVLEQPAASPPPEPAAARPDTLAQSVVLMLGLIVAQRLIGFARTVLFCRWLDPVELGEWDMALAFFSLAAPLAVLGVSGSFGRYVEHFRQARQLQSFIRQATMFTGVALVAWSGLLLLRPDWVSLAIFGRPDRLALVQALVAGLVAVVALNYVNDLLNGLRKFRASSAVQLVQGLGFAVFGVLLVWAWQRTALAVVAAYVAATLLAAAVGGMQLGKLWPDLQDGGERLPSRRIFERIASFAAWMWLTNALANLFSYVDRYVILHHCGLDEDAALALVGNYHTARVLPLLMSSVAVTVAGAMLPHLSHDWESGRRQQVGERTMLTLKLFSIGLTLGGLAVLVAAPVLFEFALRGKFTAGQEVLNWTLACGVWVGLQAAVYNYLWCAERPRLVSLAILGGLLLNVALNFFLVPRYGLAGAVWGTSAANLAVLLMVVGLSGLVGLKMDARLLAALALPLLLCLPTIWAVAAACVIAAIGWRSERLLSAGEKQQLRQVAAQYWRRVLERGSRTRESSGVG